MFNSLHALADQVSEPLQDAKSALTRLQYEVASGADDCHEHVQKAEKALGTVTEAVLDFVEDDLKEKVSSPDFDSAAVCYGAAALVRRTAPKPYDYLRLECEFSGYGKPHTWNISTPNQFSLNHFRNLDWARSWIEQCEDAVATIPATTTTLLVVTNDALHNVNQLRYKMSDKNKNIDTHTCLGLTRLGLNNTVVAQTILLTPDQYKEQALAVVSSRPESFNDYNHVLDTLKTAVS